MVDYEQAYLRRLHDFEDALAWGDEWERAYQEERREHLREVKRLRDRIFELEHALKAKEFEAALPTEELAHTRRTMTELIRLHYGLDDPPKG